jgi:hypothetical protein
VYRKITSKHHLIMPHSPNTCGDGRDPVTVVRPTGLHIHSNILRQWKKIVMAPTRHPVAHTVSLVMPINC